MARTHSSRTLLRVTHGATDERLARMLIRGSATIAAWLDDNGVRLQDPASGAMPYSRRTAFFLGGGKAMINALYATALRLGVRIGYDSEVVALSFDDDRGCEADIAHDGSIGASRRTPWCCARRSSGPISTGCAKALAPPPTVL